MKRRLGNAKISSKKNAKLAFFWSAKRWLGDVAFFEKSDRKVEEYERSEGYVVAGGEGVFFPVYFGLGEVSSGVNQGGGGACGCADDYFGSAPGKSGGHGEYPGLYP